MSKEKKSGPMSVTVPVIREVLLRRVSGVGDKCCLCEEYPPDGCRADMNISHLPVLCKDRSICHACIETLFLAWKKARENPEKVSPKDGHLLESRTVFPIECHYSEDEVASG